MQLEYSRDVRAIQPTEDKDFPVHATGKGYPAHVGAKSNEQLEAIQPIYDYICSGCFLQKINRIFNRKFNRKCLFFQSNFQV